MGWGDMVTDIFNVGKDVFLQKEANKAYIERQAATIEGQRTLTEAKTAQMQAESKLKASTLMYIGGGLVAIAIFIQIYRSI